MEDDEITHWLELPAGMGFVPFSELARLIARAQHPIAEADEEYDFDYNSARVNLDEELPKSVAAGLLKVRNPAGNGIHTFPHGYALQSAVVKVSELRSFLADRGMGVRFASAPLGEPVPTAALVAEPLEAPPLEDHSSLATRKQLIAAFGTFTEMSMEWFGNLKNTPALLKARKVAGVGARGKTREPLFCPWEVMLWLMEPKRKKGREFHNVSTPWRLLETHFPASYAKHAKEDPREERTG